MTIPLPFRERAQHNQVRQDWIDERTLWEVIPCPMLRPVRTLGTGTRLHPPAFGGMTQT